MYAYIVVETVYESGGTDKSLVIGFYGKNNEETYDKAKSFVENRKNELNTQKGYRFNTEFNIEEVEMQEVESEVKE